MTRWQAWQLTSSNLTCFLLGAEASDMTSSPIYVDGEQGLLR
jgi:hypothetical protein